MKNGKEKRSTSAGWKKVICTGTNGEVELQEYVRDVG
jgi:hypothetical protein